MAIARAPPLVVTPQGIVVASPNALHGSHDLRHAGNFNKVVDGFIQLIIDHAGSLGNIKYIKEWWEDPAIAGETEEFPCVYVIPLFPESPRVSKEMVYKSDPYIGDPLALTTYPITISAYYKYVDTRKPLRAVRDYGWNFWDILAQDKQTYALPSGIQSSTIDVGWFVSGTNYVIQYWTIRIKMQGIL